MTGPAGFAWSDGALDRRKVVQCALSRVCGKCGQSLGRPIAFLGDADEVARNTFHVPPLHASCAKTVQAALGPAWSLIHTAGFEFVRPAKDDLDPAPRFEPNALL